MTCREKLKIEHPELIDKKWDGGCSGCPKDHGYLDDPSYCASYGIDSLCTNCWDREIPEKKGDDTTVATTKKTKQELLYDIAELTKQVEQLDKLNKYEAASDEVYSIYQCFVNAGFEKDQAFDIVKTMIQISAKG